MPQYPTFLPNTLACPVILQLKPNPIPLPTTLPKLVLQDLKQTLVSSEKHIPRARPSHECCGSCQLGPALSSPKQPANKNLFIALLSDVTLCFLSTGGCGQPDGETHVLQSKLSDQSLLSEDKSDLLPRWEMLRGGHHRCSDWEFLPPWLFGPRSRTMLGLQSSPKLVWREQSFSIYSEWTRPGVTARLSI